MGLKESIFQLNIFLSSLKPPEEFPYNSEAIEGGQLGNGQVSNHHNDDSRRNSVKISIPRELPQRYILVIMGFFALVNIYMMYLNLFIALPAMIDHNATDALRALNGENNSIIDIPEEKELMSIELNREGRHYNGRIKTKKKNNLENNLLDQSTLSSKEVYATTETNINVAIPDDVITIPKNTKSSESSSGDSTHNSHASSALPLVKNISILEQVQEELVIQIPDSVNTESLLVSSSKSHQNSTDSDKVMENKSQDLHLTSERRKRDTKPLKEINTEQTVVPNNNLNVTTFSSTTLSDEIALRAEKLNESISDTKDNMSLSTLAISASLPSNIRTSSEDPLLTQQTSTIALNASFHSSPKLNPPNKISSEIYEPAITVPSLENLTTLNATTKSELSMEDTSKSDNQKSILPAEESSLLFNSDDVTPDDLDIGTATESVITDDSDNLNSSKLELDSTQLPAIETVTQVNNDFSDSTDIINPENFFTEESIAIETEKSDELTTFSPITSSILSDLVNTQSSNENLLTGDEKIGVLVFSIPSINALNNTIIPNIRGQQTEKSKQKANVNRSSLINSKIFSSINGALSNFGVPLPILDSNNTNQNNFGVPLDILDSVNSTGQNNTLVFNVPLSIPCQKFAFSNCSVTGGYDVLDNQGVSEMNDTENYWVTLRPLPKTRLRSSNFYRLFGSTVFDSEEDSFKSHIKMSRKYNFTDHFKLVNCSRVTSLKDDESDSEIECFSSLGVIRLNIVDESDGSSSSSSSSSSSEEGSQEEEDSEEEEGGSEEEENEEGEEDDEEKENNGQEENNEEGEEDEEKDKNTSVRDSKGSNRSPIKRRKSLVHKAEHKKEDKKNQDDENEDEKGDEEKKNEEQDDEEEHVISPRFRPSNIEKSKKYSVDSSEEYDEEEEDEEEEEEEEEGEEEEEEEDNKKGKKYGSSPIKLDAKIPSSVCFVKKIVGEIVYEDFQNGEFVWLPDVQSNVLEAYYWGFVLTQIPSGKLAGVIGGKLIMLIGIVCAGIITLLSPVLASTGAYWLLTGRFFLGMFLGLCLPALQSLLAQWSPPLERTKMVACTYSGIAIGAALGAPLSEYIVQVIGWKTLFYTQGILALLWGIFWFFLVTDSPSTHPKITNKEKQFVLGAIGQQHAGRPLPVPWCSIIRSQHVLALMLAQGSFKWAWHNLLHYAPRYVSTVMHRTRSEVQYVWGAAFGCMFVITCVYGVIGDWLRKSRKTSTEFVRRAANSICSLLTAAFLVGVAQAFCNINAVKVCFALAIAIGIPGAFSGIYVNSIDMAPNHAAIITGICGTFATTANILAPFYWNLIVYERPTLERWRTIWYTSAIFLLLANCLYFLLVGTKEQRWNRPVTLTKTPKKREEDQGAISRRRMNYTHGLKNQAYASTEHL